MGMITVQIRGSFGTKPDAQFSATEGGHAYALTGAIAYLVTQMGSAIRKDHALHDKSQHPDPDFGERDHDEQERP